jgi:photosystem II stability/assembly factor-like uncharacterized protein
MLRLARRSVPTIAGIVLLCALAALGVYRYAFADVAEQWVIVSQTDPIEYVVPIGTMDHRDVRIDSGYLAVSAVDTRTAFAVGWYSNTDDPTVRPLWGRTTNGSTWSVPASMTARTGRLRAVDAVTANNVWAVGDGGLVLRWNGSSWEQRAAGVTTAQLNGVAFADASNGWIVGNAGTVLWTVDGGSNWTTPSVGFTGNLNAVSAAGPAYVMAVGAGGKCVRWDGSWWQSEGTGTGEDLLSVDIVDSTHGIAVGANGTFLRWQGDAWYVPTLKAVEPGYSNTVRSVTLSDRGTGVAVGDWGMVWRTGDAGDHWWFEQVPTYPGGTEYDRNRAGVDTAPNDASRVWMTGDDPTVPPYPGVVEFHIARVYQGTLNYLPPDAPVSLVATATAPGPAAMLRWNNIAGAATDFEIERSMDTTAVWTPLATALATPGQMTLSDPFDGVSDSDAWGATWYYRVRARSSRYGDSDWVVAPGLRLDPDPPVTTVSPTLGGWFTTSQTVALATSDRANGSGVAYEWLRVGAGAPTVARSYSAGEGVVALEWGSTDVAGNIETTKSATVKVDVTDPVTTPTVAVKPVYWGPAVIALDATDNLSGLAGTAWRLNGGTEASGTSVVVSEPGNHTLEFHSHDVAGHVETTRTRTFRVVPEESAPPTDACVLWADPDPAVLVSWHDASDNESGFVVQRAQDTTDPAAFVDVKTLGPDVTEWTDPLEGFDLDTKRHSWWYYRVRSYTPVRDSVWVQAGGIHILDTPPVTTAGVNGVERSYGYDAPADWLSSAQVTLTVRPAGAETFYRIDGVGELTTYTVPVAVSAGVHVFEYRSTLLNHEDEVSRTVTVRVDTTPPVTTANVGLTASQPLLVLTTADAQSGPGTTWYAFDGGAETTYSPPVAVPRGVHTVTWHSHDAAGNEELPRSGTIIGGPQASVSTPKGSSSTRVRRTLTFSGTLTRTTNHKRLTLLAYKFDGVSWVLIRSTTVTTHTPSRRGKTTYRGSIKFTSKGSWKVVARYAGDTRYVQSFSAPRYVRVR